MVSKGEREDLLLGKLRLTGYRGSKIPSVKYRDSERSCQEPPIQDCDHICYELDQYLSHGRGDPVKVANRVGQAVRLDALEDAGLEMRVIHASQDCKDFIASGTCDAGDNANDLAASILSMRKNRSTAIRENMTFLGIQAEQIEMIFSMANSDSYVGYDAGASRLLDNFLAGNLQVDEAAARMVECIRKVELDRRKDELEGAVRRKRLDTRHVGDDRISQCASVEQLVAELESERELRKQTLLQSLSLLGVHDAAECIESRDSYGYINPYEGRDYVESGSGNVDVIAYEMSKTKRRDWLRDALIDAGVMQPFSTFSTSDGAEAGKDSRSLEFTSSKTSTKEDATALALVLSQERLCRRQQIEDGLIKTCSPAELRQIERTPLCNQYIKEGDVSIIDVVATVKTSVLRARLTAALNAEASRIEDPYHIFYLCEDRLKPFLADERSVDYCKGASSENVNAVAKGVCGELQDRYAALRRTLSFFGNTAEEYHLHAACKLYVVHGVGSLSDMRTKAWHLQRMHVFKAALDSTGTLSFYHLQGFWKNYNLNYNRVIIQICRQKAWGRESSSLLLTCLGRCESKCAEFVFGGNCPVEVTTLQAQAGSLVSSLQIAREERRQQLSNCLGCNASELPTQYNWPTSVGFFDLAEDDDLGKACEEYVNYGVFKDDDDAWPTRGRKILYYKDLVARLHAAKRAERSGRVQQRGNALRKAISDLGVILVPGKPLDTFYMARVFIEGREDPDVTADHVARTIRAELRQEQIEDALRTRGLHRRLVSTNQVISSYIRGETDTISDLLDSLVQDKHMRSIALESALRDSGIAPGALLTMEYSEYDLDDQDEALGFCWGADSDDEENARLALGEFLEFGDGALSEVVSRIGRVTRIDQLSEALQSRGPRGMTSDEIARWVRKDAIFESYKEGTIGLSALMDTIAHEGGMNRKYTLFTQTYGGAESSDEYDAWCDDGFCPGDDPMQEYYDQGYGSC